MSILAVLIIELAGWAARHRQDLPWMPLDLGVLAGRSRDHLHLDIANRGPAAWTACY